MGLTRQMRAHPIQVEEKSFDYKDSTSGVLGETNDPLSSPDGINTRMICSVKGASGAQSLTADNTDILSPASNPNKNREKCTENLNINEEEQSKNIPFLTMEGEEEEPRYSDDLLQKAMELCGLQNEGGTAHSQTIDLTIALPKDLNPPKTFYTLPAETQTPPQYFPSSKRTQSRLHQEPLVKLNTENVSFMLPPSKSEKPYVPFGYNSSGNIKQPMNSYMIWRRIHHSALARANPTASSRDINIQLGWEWRRLTEEQKKTYYIEAWKLRTIHREMFPDWTFTRRTDKNEKALPTAIYNSSTPTMSPYIHTTGKTVTFPTTVYTPPQPPGTVIPSETAYGPSSVQGAEQLCGPLKTTCLPDHLHYPKNQNTLEYHGYHRFFQQFFLREPLFLPSQHFGFQPRMCEKDHYKQRDPMISGFTRDFTCFDVSDD